MPGDYVNRDTLMGLIARYGKLVFSGEDVRHGGETRAELIEALGYLKETYGDVRTEG